MNLLIAANSITSKDSVIDGPYRYSHHQTVLGLTFDAIVVLSFLVWGALVAYYNFGPPARKRAAAAK
jgi:hypothetical protein